jgi:hypothetical protein
MDLLAFFLGAFVILPLALGFALPPRVAWGGWAAVTAFMVVAQALSGEVQAFTVAVAVLAVFGSLFVMIGVRLRGARIARQRT